MLRIYADESETNATAIGGFVADVEYWKEFAKKWHNKLGDFGAPYFHFREFATKELYTQPGRTYYGWSESKRDKFLLELTSLASEEAVPILGGYAPNVGEKQSPEQRWEKSIIKLFEDLNIVLTEVWPTHTDKILFVFDKGNTDEKNLAVLKVHSEFSAKDVRFGGLTFEDDKNPMHAGLQAADLMCYIQRQSLEKLKENDNTLIPDETRVLDLLILRKRHTELRNLPRAQWERFVKILLRHRKSKLAEWKKKGIKQAYLPNKHFPWSIYGNKAREPA